MADLNSINFKGNRIAINLSISKDEYDLLKGEKNLLAIPASSFDFMLITGTLGNSNRIMLPNKILRKNNIDVLIKNVPSKIITTKKGKYLILQLEGAKDIPKFKT